VSPPIQPDPPLPLGQGDLSALLAVAPALLPALLDAIPARVVVLDPEERLSYGNPAFYAFTGLEPEHILGCPIRHVIGEQANAHYATVRERLARGETVCWEDWIELNAVGPRYMREHLVPAFDAQGQRLGTIVISLDWTELRQNQQQLQARLDELHATQALKSSIVDQALAAIISTDAQGRIVEFNPAAEALFGHTRAAVLGRLVEDVVIPPRHRAGHRAGMARVAKGGPARMLGQRLEMDALRADGSEFPVEMVLSRNAVGDTSFYTASMFDLTERRNAQAQIERQRDALRQSEKLTAMGSLLAGVAHELNNPLAIVMGRASLLEEKMAEHPLASDAHRIREAAERCGRIVRTFLNMARSRAPQRAPVQINDLASAAAEMLQYNLRSHGIELDLLLGDDLPTVLADGDQIGQVILNLLVNAQQALAANEPPRRLQIATGVEPRRDGREPWVWLRVVDNGRGIPEALHERIFEPFFTTKPEGLGTGLGLAVSRSIVRDHGGDLRVEPRGPGACFRLGLPVSGQASPEPEAAPAAAEAPEHLARVLVVDDEPEIAALIRAFLESAGYEVASAESGALALELLDAGRFDAIVSDLRMPDMDGAALWRAVGERHPLLARRMLFVTGDTLSPGARGFLSQTGCPALDKPFSKADLLGGVKELLG